MVLRADGEALRAVHAAVAADGHRQPGKPVVDTTKLEGNERIWLVEEKENSREPDEMVQREPLRGTCIISSFNLLGKLNWGCGTAG